MLFAPAKKTVDGVMNAFTTTIAQLKDVASASAAEREQHIEQIRVSQAALDAATTEQSRALSIAGKLEALVGDAAAVGNHAVA